MTNMMVEIATEKLKQAGVRMTVQRKVIMNHIYESDNHPTAEEIFAEVCNKHSDFKTLSVGTIYNNLKILKKHGLIREIFSNSGIARYDSNLSSHHHLVCMSCGKIIDFYHSIPLPIEELNNEHDFQVADLTLEVRGKCRDCSNNSIM